MQSYSNKKCKPQEEYSQKDKTFLKTNDDNNTTTRHQRNHTNHTQTIALKRQNVTKQ